MPVKSIRMGILSLVAIVFASCNFTEEIYLSEDGSGSIALSFDGSELMSITGEEGETPGQQAMDSVIYFSDILAEKKDSIASLPEAEQQRLAKLEPYRMHMKADPEAKSLFFSLERDFTDIGEIQDSFNAFQDASALDPDDNDSPMAASTEFYQSTDVSFSYGKGRFSRRAFITDSLLHQQRIDSLAGTEAFLSGSTYTLKIHFPRKVKSASTQEATLSMDGKTLIREVDFMEYLKNPSLLDMEVELED